VFSLECMWLNLAYFPSCKLNILCFSLLCAWCYHGDFMKTTVMAIEWSWAFFSVTDDGESYFQLLDVAATMRWILQILCILEGLASACHTFISMKSSDAIQINPDGASTKVGQEHHIDLCKPSAWCIGQVGYTLDQFRRSECTMTNDNIDYKICHFTAIVMN